jgi:hypothetical protein
MNELSFGSNSPVIATGYGKEGGLLPGRIFAGGSLIRNENLRSRKRISKELFQPKRHS